MGKILNNFRFDLVDNFIQSNNIYYAFAADSTGSPFAKVEDNSINSSQNYLAYSMQFGKKITDSDIKPVIKKITWEYDTLYDMYDDKDIDLSTKNYYVMTPPIISGGFRHVFKCLDNNNKANSLQMPDVIQSLPFKKSDGYIWKYMYTIEEADYNKWATEEFIPIIANTEIKETAYQGGIDKIVIDNSGMNYITFHQGIIRSVVNSSLLQIDHTASTDNDFYNLSSIYLFNTTNQTGQLREIVNYTSNSSGKWIDLKTSANTSLITAGLTQYIISPTVKIIGDGDRPAKAYSLVANNQISDIIIIDSGQNYSYSSVKISANNAYGSLCSARAIIPPIGGHGYMTEAELNIKGYSINIQFNGSENGVIQTIGDYSTIGILKNPYQSANSSNIFQSNSFNQILKTSISSNTVFEDGETVIGTSSLAEAIVFHSNSSSLWLTGDKHFSNNEIIVGQTSGLSTAININTIGDIYSKKLDILYYHNIPMINRSISQKETYKILIAV